jgi:hypothetical protein
MNNHTEPTGSIHRSRIRLETGLDVLERWNESATQTEKNAVYKALFAIADGSVFKAYRVVDDWQRLNEFFVLVKDNLVVKVRVHSFESYGVVFVGPADQAPGIGGSFGTGLAG